MTVGGVGEHWRSKPQQDRGIGLGTVPSHITPFATEIFSAQGVALQFDAPADGAAFPIATALRRQVFLLFKEAVNNAASHSGCRRAQVTLTAAHGVLALTVADDGAGFGEVQTDGHGLATMSARARALGGTLAIESSPGAGTRVVLRAPLARRQWRWSRAT
jgi:signal transduction histidine kinase